MTAVFFLLLLATPITIVILVSVVQRLKYNSKISAEECAEAIHEILRDDYSFFTQEDLFIDLNETINRVHQEERILVQKIYYNKYGRKLSEDLYKALSHSPFAYDIMKHFT